MSEADDLMIYGVAAAKAKSKDEARYYLEWALRSDADFDQQADAWYWLSTIADDPAEKRSCLENVLAINPRYGEARRDLAILDGRLKPEQLLDPRTEVQPVVPQPEVEQDELRSYKCPRCGAQLVADRVTGALVCTFCGYKPQAADDASAGRQKSNSVQEQDWTSAIYAAKGHRWEIPTARTFKCAECGANVLVPPGLASTACPFCGTPHVIQAQAEADLLEPNGFLPFKFTAAEAITSIAGWLGGQHFAPSRLGARSTQSTPHPVFLPFWTFDIEGEVRWGATEVDFEFGRATEAPASGTVPLLYQDYLVPGTGSVPGEILDSLRFNLAGLLPYSAYALASWPAEIYSVSAADASITARAAIMLKAKDDRAIKSEAELGANAAEFKITGTDLSIISYKLVLLPVWIGSYLFEGRIYQVVANGDSGEVSGNVPRSAFQSVLTRLFGPLMNE